VRSSIIIPACINIIENVNRSMKNDFEALTTNMAVLRHNSDDASTTTNNSLVCPIRPPQLQSSSRQLSSQSSADEPTHTGPIEQKLDNPDYRALIKQLTPSERCAVVLVIDELFCAFQVGTSSLVASSMSEDKFRFNKVV
jgi:hypothetical protein